MTPPLPQVPLPPAAGECLNIVQPAQPGSSPIESATKVFRSREGKLRVDSGNTSTILDLAKRETIILDHLNKEARIFPMQQVPAGQGLPGGLPNVPGALPNLPQPVVEVQELGKSIIEGHEVEGKRFTIRPPALPQAPGVPQPPAPPQVKMPGMPNLPQGPNAPIAVSEVWTSTKLQLPVLTKTIGNFGQQTCKCKYAAMADPAPSTFQIPPDYKMWEPPELPKPPNLQVPKPPVPPIPKPPNPLR